MEPHGRTPEEVGAKERAPAAAPEPSGPADAEDLPPELYGAFQQLQRRLRSMFGAAGSQLLYRRSLIAATAQHAVLRGADPSASPDQLIQSLQPTAERRPGQIAAALDAIIAEEKSLLERLIGEDLLRAVLLSSTEPPPPSKADREPHLDE